MKITIISPRSAPRKNPTATATTRATRRLFLYPRFSFLGLCHLTHPPVEKSDRSKGQAVPTITPEASATAMTKHTRFTHQTPIAPITADTIKGSHTPTTAIRHPRIRPQSHATMPPRGHRPR
ncbi:MAG: hypothetical protein G8D79_01480 [gamma proteobacterium symbiont of Ctena orbiculata]